MPGFIETAMLFERFPKIGFYLNVGEFTSCELTPLSSEKIEEMKKKLASLTLQNKLLLYVLGLRRGEFYFLLKDWLAQDAKRVLLFWEEDLAVFDAFARCPEAEEVLKCRQVHLHYVENLEKWKDDVVRLAFQFRVVGVDVIGGVDADPDRVEYCRLEILRRHVVSEGFFVETINAAECPRNILRNLSHLPRASHVNQWRGAFPNIPAIICGAGPSLDHSLEELRSVDKKALIIAGGSALSVFSQANVEPHLALAIDPNTLEYSCLQNMKLKQAPFIFVTRLNHKVLSLVADLPLGCITSQVGGIGNWIDRDLGLDQQPLTDFFGIEEQSVTSLALHLAVFLGCDPIILVGVDLAYTEGRLYAKGGLNEEKIDYETLKEKAFQTRHRPLWREDVYGNQTLTRLQWVMESSAIALFAKYYSDRRFINATAGGLGFDSICHLPLKKALKDSCQKEYDLRERIAQLLDKHRLPVSKEMVKAFQERFDQSVQRALVLCRAYLKEIEKGNIIPTGKMVLYEYDLQEEPIYQFLLKETENCSELRFYDSEKERLARKWKNFLEILLDLSSPQEE